MAPSPNATQSVPVPVIDQKLMPVFSDLSEPGSEAAASGTLVKEESLSRTPSGAEPADVAEELGDPDAVSSATGAESVVRSATAAENPEPTSSEQASPPLSETAQKQESLQISMNIVWVLVTGFLVMFMQAGFALVETGFTRAKNVGHTMSMNFMVYAVGMLGYWFSGFAFQMGGTGAPNSVSTVTTLGPEVGEQLNTLLGIEYDGKFFGLIGWSGFMLPAEMMYGGIFALFLFQMVFMDTAATIPTGAMSERWKFPSFLLTSLLIGGFIYPVYACWVWGGGWLAALGQHYGLGHGHVDFAGSSVVHLCGGVLAFVGAALLGPRYGKFDRDGTIHPIPGHNLAYGFAGTFVLAFGWFGFNAGSTLSATDPQIGVIATNTMLAGSAGAVTGMIMAWILFRKPDPSFMCNGMLAGLVSITAPCAFVDSPMAVLIGAIGGLIVVPSALIVEKFCRVDDPVGAVSVHGVCGIWGCLSVGIFANGRYGSGWNGVEGNVTGLLYGDERQIIAQLIGVGACVFGVGLLAFIVFGLQRLTIGLRTPVRAEIAGLDIAELGALGYQPDLNPEPNP